MALPSTKSKAKARTATTMTKKPSFSAKLGTPAQHAQPSRKGKRAWRKNIDIGEVEEGLEEIRQEERVVGSALQTKTNDELFQVDVIGDNKVRKSLPRFNASQLTSSKILAQRSAVPAVLARGITSSIDKKKKSKHSVSREDKVRLLRIAKRKRRGPLNTVMDPTELGSGSAMLDPSHAVKMSGSYDIWTQGGDEKEEEGEMLPGTVRNPQPKPPQTQHPRSMIEVPAVAEPHQGISYNPPVDSHQEVLRSALEKEERRLLAAHKFDYAKEAMELARANAEDTPVNVASGMTVDVDVPAEEGVEADAEEGAALKKPPPRKTKQQRQIAARLRSEKQALSERAAKKRMLQSINSVRSMRSHVKKSLAPTEAARSRRILAREKRMKESGMAGMRLGRHQVPEGQVDVQLGEDLSESLRGLKPEGNLFRDRFLSMQQRALIEPRVPVLPKRRRNKSKEVEKFAWKHFT